MRVEGLGTRFQGVGTCDNPTSGAAFRKSEAGGGAALVGGGGGEAGLGVGAGICSHPEKKEAFGVLAGGRVASIAYEE